MTQLREFPIFVPPLSLQQAFALRIAAVDKFKYQLQTQLTYLNSLFTSLQHRAFRGEL